MCYKALDCDRGVGWSYHFVEGEEIAFTAEERLTWWLEARFGVFILWGLYAIPAGEWNGMSIQLNLTQSHEFTETE